MKRKNGYYCWLIKYKLKSGKYGYCKRFPGRIRPEQFGNKKDAQDWIKIWDMKLAKPVRVWMQIEEVK